MILTMRQTPSLRISGILAITFLLLTLTAALTTTETVAFYEQAFEELLHTLRNPKERIVAKVETIDVAIPASWKPHEKYYKLVQHMLAMAQNPAGTPNINPPIPQQLRQAFRYLQNQRHEKPALATVFKGLGGNHNLAQQWTDPDHCQWKGITCNKEKLVTRLELPQLQLGGTLPTELVLLQHLKVLILTHNQLVGTIPNAYHGIPVLHLDRNALTGTIPSSAAAREWSLSDNLYV